MDVCCGHRSGDNDMQDDLIYRQAAIDAMDDIANFVCVKDEDYILQEEAIDNLKQLPSAQQWIPCSERLPEESGLYIVTNVGRWVEPVGTRYYNIRADGGFWSGHPGDKVLAWMELPPVYKEDTDD